AIPQATRSRGRSTGRDGRPGRRGLGRGRRADAGQGCNTNLGRVLVDAHGKTLYVWAHDKTSTSTCNGPCAQFWPPLISRGKASPLAGVQAKLLGTSRRRDGRLQITYAGHPLYYFANDTRPGQTNGEGLT